MPTHIVIESSLPLLGIWCVELALFDSVEGLLEMLTGNKYIVSWRFF